jgi:hypothetical protein
MASLACVAWSLPSFSCCCCNSTEILLSCSLICSSTVTLASSTGSGGATTSAMLHTKCFSPFFAHDGVSDAAAEPRPDTACSVRQSMPLGGGGVWSLSSSIWTSGGGGGGGGGRGPNSKPGGPPRPPPRPPGPPPPRGPEVQSAVGSSVWGLMTERKLSRTHWRARACARGGWGDTPGGCAVNDGHGRCGKAALQSQGEENNSKNVADLKCEAATPAAAGGGGGGARR